MCSSDLIANAWLDNTNTYGPLGSTEYRKIGEQFVEVPMGANGQRTKRIAVPQFEQINRLSDDQMRLLNLQEAAGQNLGELAVQQSRRMQDYLRGGINQNRLPDDVRKAAQADQLLRATSPDDFSEDRRRVEQALFSRLTPQMDRDRAAMETRLANQGVVQGSEAYRNAMRELNQKENDLRMQTVLGAAQEQNRLYGLEQQRVDQANRAIQGDFGNELQSQQTQQTLRQQALQEEAFLRQLPINELSMLMNGAAPTMPQFQGWSGPTVANTDVSGNFYRSAALEQQNYLAQMQQQNAMMGGLFGLGGSVMGLFSDRRLKDNIKKVGKLDNGLSVYSYTMNGVPQIGLMADEVEKVKPEAVGQVGGFKTVRYDMAVEA